MAVNNFYYSIYILLFVGSFLNACNGQVNTSAPKDATYTDKPGPTVIRNFKAVPAPPDFDTTLVSQYIRSIFQDSKGNLWFGTLGEGVVRYDTLTSLSTGTTTLTYFSNPDGFHSNSVYAINEDKHGHLWFGTDQGVYSFDEETFRKYTQTDGLSHIDISRKSILVDKSGNIWVGTHGGVFRYDPIADSKGEQSFTLFEQLPPINVADIMEDNKGNIWFASEDNGVFRFDPSSSRKAGEKAIVNITEKQGLGGNYAGGMAQDKSGNIWFLMKDGICRYDGKTFTEVTSKDGLGGTEFWGIYIEQSGIIWITARGSTTRYDPSVPISDPKAFKVFTPKDGLNCCVQSMYQDRSGNMWWGAGSGLFRFDGQRFYQVKQNGPW